MRTSATPEPVLLGVQVHGATLAGGAALREAVQLGHDAADGVTAHKLQAVAAVGADDVVVSVEASLQTDTDGLLQASTRRVGREEEV